MRAGGSVWVWVHILILNFRWWKSKEDVVWFGAYRDVRGARGGMLDFECWKGGGGKRERRRKEEEVRIGGIYEKFF